MSDSILNSTSPNSGAERVFRHTVRVPYAHTDQMRYVYYANYLIYFEMARSEMLRAAGLPYGELENQGVFLPVTEAVCHYKAPAHFDDLLEVLSTCEFKGARLKINYTINRLTPSGDVNLIVTGYTIHACISKAGRVMRPPVSLIQSLV